MLCRTAADQRAKLEDDRVRNRVVNAIPLASTVHQTRLIEGLEMFRDVGLVSRKSLDDVTDGPLATFQYLEDAQSLRFAQHSEAARNKIDHLVGKVKRSTIHIDYITIW